MEKLRVLLIETNRLLRKGITSLLNEQGDITAMASTGNRDALVKAREFAPHVVLLDLGFKIQRSQRILNSIRNHLPHAEVVVLDLFPAHSTIVNYAKLVLPDMSQEMHPLMSSWTRSDQSEKVSRSCP